MIDTGALTDLLIAHLVAAIAADPAVTDPAKPPPVGDNVAPAAGGWVDGQPGAGVYVPYLVVVTAGSAPRTLAQSTTVPAWGCGYSVRAHGGNRTQTDWMAKVGRDAIAGLKGHLFGADPAWGIINVEWTGLGPMLRNDSTAPPSWSVADTVTLVADTSLD